MAIYLVSARPHRASLSELQGRLQRGEIRDLEPFGRALQRSLQGARVDEEGRAWWEEIDYCSPPLAQERAAVLDTYFTDIKVEPVAEGEGWRSIESLPSLWEDRPLS